MYFIKPGGMKIVSMNENRGHGNLRVWYFSASKKKVVTNCRQIS